ncbi:hypothetical protein IGI04_030655 [Brassica rapa subsp. trilocularis]|uniref:Uncharacterized protein n=1 Tax=Brassica rapa subsp. trilocularis TaxID=1813537 RepID=A0ABQ7LUR3_BRACM|nr:hypothetical protein IGI04_030655 [Brassica rapa subsp. trilocularis]
MAATKMFLIKWYSSSTNLKVFQIWKTSETTYLLVVWKSSLGKSSDKVVWTSRKSSGLPGSRLDFQEVVWISRKSSGFPGSRLDFSERFGFSDLEDFWDDLLVSRLEVVWKSSGRLEVKSSGLLKSRLVLSTQVESKLTTYNSVVHETTEIRLKFKSSGEVKLLKLSSQMQN